MVTEDYVSFETAKLLKEKGFNEKCHYFYEIYRKKWKLYHDLDDYYPNGISNSEHDNNGNNAISAPPLAMAMKWLREENRCIIVPNPTWFTAEGGCKKWSFSIWADDNLEVDGEDPKTSTDYDSYEEACEEAIRYCLENLI